MLATIPAQPLSRRCRLTVFSAQQPRRRRPASQPDEDSVGGVGFAVLTALKSDPPPPALHRHSARRTTKPPPKAEEEEVEDSRTTSLRGSDVIQALQRAAVASQNTKKVKKKRRPTRSSDGGGGEQLLPVDYDYTTVRPIQIRSDWVVRLDEMERRIQQLQTQHP